jgi:DNA-binding HxlR family transcriptional regulator
MNIGVKSAIELNNSSSKISLSDVIKSISDDKSLSIFKTIADVDSNGEINLKRKSGLTRKQYYSRLSTIMATGLIKRQSGRYSLTAFGRVVYCCMMMICQSAFNNYYKLRAIDSVEGSDFSNEDFMKFVDVLIDNQKIKEFLTEQC